MSWCDCDERKVLHVLGIVRFLWVSFLFLLVRPDPPPPPGPSSLFPFPFHLLYRNVLFLDLCSPPFGQFRSARRGIWYRGICTAHFYSTSQEHKVGRDALNGPAGIFPGQVLYPLPFAQRGKRREGEGREGRFPSSVQPPPDHHQ